MVVYWRDYLFSNLWLLKPCYTLDTETFYWKSKKQPWTQICHNLCLADYLNCAGRNYFQNNFKIPSFWGKPLLGKWHKRGPLQPSPEAVPILLSEQKNRRHNFKSYKWPHYCKDVYWLWNTHYHQHRIYICFCNDSNGCTKLKTDTHVSSSLPGNLFCRKKSYSKDV